MRYYPYKDYPLPCPSDKHKRLLYFQYWELVCKSFENFREKEVGLDPTAKADPNKHFVCMELKIDGVEVDIEKFFENYLQNLEGLICREAEALCQQLTTDKLKSIVETTDALKEKIDQLSDESYFFIKKELKNMRGYEDVNDQSI